MIATTLHTSQKIFIVGLVIPPVEAVTRTGDNTVQLKGPEKQVLLTDFVKHVETMFPGRRGRSLSRSAESRSSSSRKSKSRKVNSS